MKVKMSLIALVIVIHILQNAEALHCSNCFNIKDPSDCTYIQECNPKQECYIEQIGILGPISYHLGCRNLSESKCDYSIVHEPGPYIGPSLIWSGCCREDYCNLNFDRNGDVKATAPLLCYECSLVTDTSFCKQSVRQCDAGQECITTTTEENGKRYYSMGCSVKGKCEMEILRPIPVGKRSATKTCKECCSNNSFCHANHCGVSV